MRVLVQATRKKSAGSVFSVQVLRGLRKGALFVFGLTAVYLLISLLSYRAADPGWSHSTGATEVSNAGGVAGAWFADVFIHLFGYMAFLFPFLAAYAGWRLFIGRHEGFSLSLWRVLFKTLGFFLTLSAGAGLATLHFSSVTWGIPGYPGGILGDLVGGGLAQTFSFLGTTLFLLAVFLTGITLLTDLSWLGLAEAIGRITLAALAQVNDGVVGRLQRRSGAAEAAQETHLTSPSNQTSAWDNIDTSERTRGVAHIEPSIEEPPAVERMAQAGADAQGTPLADLGYPSHLSDLGLSPVAEMRDSGDNAQDPLYDQAVRLVTESQQGVSIAVMQRRLKVGYNRAARIIEEMERVGIVGPPQSNGNREVLVPPPPEE